MKTEPSAKVIADSISEEGYRLTTMEVVMHRYVLAEFNTHRVFSRNSASSRAIPSRLQRQNVQTDPAIPIEFGTNQPGMQAGTALTGTSVDRATYAWIKAMHAAVEASRCLDSDLNVHKQVANRVLEPWMWHTAIISSTEWEGFYNQRCSPLAQPEIKVVADAMKEAQLSSQPATIHADEWHLPYVQNDERDLPVEDQKKLSAARCARVSYLTHDGVRDHEKDFELYDRLVTASPPHFSPLEHVATPDPQNVAMIYNQKYGHMVQSSILGNFAGWRQLRHDISGERLL